MSGRSDSASAAVPDQAVSQAFETLQSLFSDRERTLTERERDFDRKVSRFEREYPNAGRDSDILQLNVGGTNVVVSRRTLTIFSDSMLAAKFSGRWDDSLEKDSEGKIFIDQDPECFLRLISYLRKVGTKRREDLRIPKPELSFDFCWMLEYFELLDVIYPPDWVVCDGSYEKNTPGPGVSELVNNNVLCGAMCCPGIQVSSIMIEVKHNTIAQIGWTSCDFPWYEDSEIARAPHMKFDMNLKEYSQKNRLGIEKRATHVDTMMYNALDVTFLLTRTRDCVYSISAKNCEPITSKDFRQFVNMKPFISFTGTVTISNVQYSY